MYKKIAIAVLVLAPLVASLADNFTSHKDIGNAIPAPENRIDPAPEEKVAVATPQPPTSWSSTIFGQPVAGAGQPMATAAPSDPSTPSPAQAPAPMPTIGAPVADRPEVNPIPDPRNFPNSGIRITTYQPDN